MTEALNRHRSIPVYRYVRGSHNRTASRSASKHMKHLTAEIRLRERTNQKVTVMPRVTVRILIGP